MTHHQRVGIEHPLHDEGNGDGHGEPSGLVLAGFIFAHVIAQGGNGVVGTVAAYRAFHGQFVTDVQSVLLDIAMHGHSHRAAL